MGSILRALWFACFIWLVAAVSPALAQGSDPGKDGWKPLTGLLGNTYYKQDNGFITFWNKGSRWMAIKLRFPVGSSSIFLVESTFKSTMSTVTQFDIGFGAHLSAWNTCNLGNDPICKRPPR